MRDIILVGGGNSISEGLELDLWEKIKDKEVWSINFAFMVMPYLPKVECWVDTSFFKNNIEALQKLRERGVKCYAKKHTWYAGIPEINVYETTRDPKEADKKVFIGRMGLSGFFALYLATQERPDRIFLLGFDFGSCSVKTHFYQDKLKIESSGIGKPNLYRDNNGTVKKEVKDFEVFNKFNVPIYNVSMISTIECFAKIEYSKFFEMIKI